MPFSNHLPVRYAEVDAQRVVFNAHYLTFCDDTCERWLRHTGLDLGALGWDVMLKRAVVEWAGSATHGDTVVVTPTVSRWGTTSFDVAYDLAVDGRTVCAATITYVGVAVGTARPIPVPDVVRAALGGGAG